MNRAVRIYRIRKRRRWRLQAALMRLWTFSYRHKGQVLFPEAFVRGEVK